MFGSEKVSFKIKYLSELPEVLSPLERGIGQQNIISGAMSPSDRAKVPPNALLRPLSGRPAPPLPARRGGVVNPLGSPPPRPAVRLAAGPTAPLCAMTGAA